jgi:O-antigen ligase
MDQKTVSLGLKSIIWACLGIVFFSVLLVFSNLFFPFITSKTYVFQIAVEVMFVAFLLLCLVDEKYRLHTNLTVLLLLAYLVILTIASAFSGNDFYHSFWSNNEREDGILLLGHLFLFSVVLTSFLRSLKEWLYAFDLFLISSFCVAIVSLDQFLALEFKGIWSDHFIPSSNGARLAATIGNAGYVGGYMVFGAFLSLFMLLKRPNVWLKVWYGFLLVLELFIAVQTQTRGAYLALGFGGLVALVYLMWFYFNDKYLKIVLVAILIAGALGLSGIFVFKDSDFIKSQPVLRRVASISLTDGTANNRMVTWKIGWGGFKERPFLGYGQENFYQVFDKYYTTKNTEQWFDRCHNMICDRAITGGILGLLSYLAFLLLPFGALWKYYREDYKNKVNDDESLAKRFLIPIIFSILIIAYIIQNLFIFEALAIYIPLIVVLSFVGIYSRSLDFDFLADTNFKTVIAVIFAVLLLPSLWFFNLKPVYANIDFIKALTASDSINLSSKVDGFEEVIGRGTMGNQEYRRHYFSFYESTLNNYISQSANRSAENDQLIADFSKKMENQFNNQIEENPYSIANYLSLMRFYNTSYYFDITRLEKAISLADKVIALSPGRPQVYFEVATSNYYLGTYYATTDKIDKAKEQFQLTLNRFYDGASKNVNNAEAFSQLAGFLLSIKQSGNNELFVEAINDDGYSEQLKKIVDSLNTWDSSSNVDQETKDKQALMLKEVTGWLVKTKK